MLIVRRNAHITSGERRAPTATPKPAARYSVYSACALNFHSVVGLHPCKSKVRLLPEDVPENEDFLDATVGTVTTSGIDGRRRRLHCAELSATRHRQWVRLIGTGFDVQVCAQSFALTSQRRRHAHRPRYLLSRASLPLDRDIARH